MEINASPWANVLHVEDAQGKSIPLPDGVQTTPLRLENVSPGTYKITLSESDNRQQTIECQLSASSHLCAALMDQPDIPQVLEGMPK